MIEVFLITCLQSSLRKKNETIILECPCTGGVMPDLGYTQYSVLGLSEHVSQFKHNCNV